MDHLLPFLTTQGPGWRIHPCYTVVYLRVKPSFIIRRAVPISLLASIVSLYSSSFIIQLLLLIKIKSFVRAI